MQNMDVSASRKVWSSIKSVGKAAVLGAGISFFSYFMAGNSSAQVIPKSNASTFFDNVPGLSLAPSTLVVNGGKKGYAALLNIRAGKKSGIHGMRVVTPDGLAIHEAGLGASSGKIDVGFAINGADGIYVVIGGMTVRFSNAVSANAVVGSGDNRKLNLVVNSDVAVMKCLAVSVRVDAQGGSKPAFAAGADANIAGVLPSASLTVREKGTQVDANLWSPKIGPDGKERFSASVTDLGGDNTLRIGIRVSL